MVRIAKVPAEEAVASSAVQKQFLRTRDNAQSPYACTAPQRGFESNSVGLNARMLTMRKRQRGSDFQYFPAIKQSVLLTSQGKLES